MTLTALEFYPQPVIDACNSCPGDWRGSVDALIQTLTSTNRCYSSGELARILRICAPSLRFAVPGIGEYTRDAFYGDNLPEYDDGQGNPVAPVPGSPWRMSATPTTPPRPPRWSPSPRAPPPRHPRAPRWC